jgi:vacuole morphology and inheritance protein 14
MNGALVKSMVDVVLPCRSHEVEGIRRGSLEASRAVLSLVRERGSDGDPRPEDSSGGSEGDAASSAAAGDGDTAATGGPIAVAPIVAAVVSSLPTRRRPTRKLSLLWLAVLLESFPTSVAAQRDAVFPVLLASLRDRADDIAVLGMDILCRMCAADAAPAPGDLFTAFISGLLALLRSDPPFLAHRLPLVLRRAAVTLDTLARQSPGGSGAALTACELYQRLAESLAAEPDVAFAKAVVERLALILFTCEEMAGVRAALVAPSTNAAAAAAATAAAAGGGGGGVGNRMVAGRQPQPVTGNTVQGGSPLLAVLLRAFSHSVGSALLLALLSRCYDLSARLVASFGRLEISLAFLIDMDRLVRMVESPVMARLRLDLLDPAANPGLVVALRGVLMTLPQGAA